MSQPYKFCPQCNQAAVLDASQCLRCGHQFKTLFASNRQPIQAFVVPHPPAKVGKTKPLSPLLWAGITVLLVICAIGFFAHNVQPIKSSAANAEQSAVDFSKMPGEFCGAYDAAEDGVRFHRYVLYEISPPGQVIVLPGDDKNRVDIEWKGPESYSWDATAVESNTAVLQTDAQWRTFTIVHPRNPNGVDAYRYYSLGYPRDNYLYLHYYEPSHPVQPHSTIINPGEESTIKYMRVDHRPNNYAEAQALFQKSSEDFERSVSQTR